MRRVGSLWWLVAAAAALCATTTIATRGPSEPAPAAISAARIDAANRRQHCTTDVELAFDQSLDDAGLIRAVASVMRSPDSNATSIRTPIQSVRVDVENNVACVTLDATVDRATVDRFLDDIETGTAVTQVRIG